ncbi:hypothetical protein [Nocardia pneumoniae]|uniref:hypothetical protein n=1 Tax=Nocardia pneumoniae TaxID=228601 RepID=UPI000593EFA0|nr:hypothetical protein [Nocardia pneumoniae]
MSNDPVSREVTASEYPPTAGWVRSRNSQGRRGCAAHGGRADPVHQLVGALAFRCNADAARDAEVIRALAIRHGYALPHLFTVESHLDSGALLRLIERVHVARAGAVIVPGMPHLGGAVPAVLTQVCSVIMPGHVVLGRSLYPAPRPSGADRSVGDLW